MGEFAAQPVSLVVAPASRARWDSPERLEADRKGKRKRKRERASERARASAPNCTNKL